MQKTVLLIHAHPEPTSLTRTLVEAAGAACLHLDIAFSKAIYTR